MITKLKLVLGVVMIRIVVRYDILLEMSKVISTDIQRKRRRRKESDNEHRNELYG